MHTANNLDLLDQAVRQHQSRIRSAARSARGYHQQGRGTGERPFRTWIGDHLIAWGQSIRGGLPDVPVEGFPELAARL